MLGSVILPLLLPIKESKGSYEKYESNVNSSLNSSFFFFTIFFDLGFKIITQQRYQSLINSHGY